MGDLGLSQAFGADATAQRLRQQIMDKLAAQQQAQQADIQGRTMALKEQEAQRAAQDFQQTLEERKAEQAAKMGAAKVGDATKLAPQLPMDQNVSPQAGNIMDQGGMGGQLYAPPTMGENVNGTQFDAAKANPRVNLGTPVQQKDASDSAAIDAIAKDPNTTPAMRGFLRVRGALPKGENIPYQLITEPNGPTKNLTGTEEDSRYEGIRANQMMGHPVSPQDLAWANAYKERKLLGPTASSAAADSRMGDQQLFTQQEAGRAALTRDVEKPYHDATAAASALRDIVTSAQAGNKFAASQQSLEGTIATIRAAGLSRINQAEYGVSAGAGNLWDRIQGSLGKQAAGQPMSPELQKDLIDYAGVLEKAAYKRYKDSHGSITKRYKLTDEKPLSEPGAETPEQRAARLRKSAGL